MLIGIDGNEANIEKRVGVGRYAYEVLMHLYKIQNSKVKSQNDNLKFKIFLKEGPLIDLPRLTDWWEYQIVGPKRFWTQLGLPLSLFLRCPKPDIFFSPTHYAPRFCPCPRVISVMDLSFLYFPKMFRGQDLWQLKSWTAYSIKKAVKILTISQASKNDIIKHYHVPPSRVVTTYPGYQTSFKSQMPNLKSIKKKYGIKGSYILSVGTLQPRKNFVRLIEAFASLQKENLELVIAGKPGWLYEEIYAAPKKFGVHNKVKFLNYVPDEDLPALYQGAACFVLVSLYEGFGIPVLEAMTHGCPVVVSNFSSLPEVAGEAGILVNPYEVKDIAAGISEVLNLSNNKRQEMVRRGLKQAEKFSWEKTAQETLRVLKEVGGKT